VNPWTSAWAGLLALAVAIGIGRFAFTPILPMMQDDAALTLSQAGWLASANYAGYLVGALTAGLRIRADIAIRTGLLVIGASTLAMGVTQQFLPWLGLRFIAGVASAWVLVFVSAWALERLAALGRPNLNGMVFAGVGTGIVIAGGACLVAMRLHAGSTAAWFSLGVLSIAITALLWALLGQGPRPAAQPEPPSVATSTNAEYRRMVLCYGAYGFGYIIPATYLPAMAKEIVADPHLFGWAWPAFGAAAVISTLYVARLSARVSHRAAWIGSHLAMALGLVIPLVVPGLAGILAAALLVGGTFVTITMVAMQEARRVAAAQARPLMAAMTAAFALGQILGPMTVSFLPRGFAPALILAASILAVSALFLLKGDRRERTDAAPGPGQDERRPA
jgi:predicted MFS family arabinose efflux permease